MKHLSGALLGFQILELQRLAAPSTQGRLYWTQSCITPHNLVFIFRNHAYIQKEFTQTVYIKTVISKMGCTRLSNASTERKVKTLISYLFLILKYKNYVLPILTVQTKTDPLWVCQMFPHHLPHTRCPEDRGRTARCLRENTSVCRHSSAFRILGHTAVKWTKCIMVFISLPTKPTLTK